MVVDGLPVTAVVCFDATTSGLGPASMEEQSSGLQGAPASAMRQFAWPGRHVWRLASARWSLAYPDWCSCSVGSSGKGMCSDTSRACKKCVRAMFRNAECSANVRAAAARVDDEGTRGVFGRARDGWAVARRVPRSCYSRALDLHTCTMSGTFSGWHRRASAQSATDICMFTLSRCCW